jgi:bla regulator protein BlaR1
MSIVTLFERIFLLSLMGTIPALGILLLKGILKDHLSARLQYYIWLLLIVRLLLPFTFESPLSLFPYQSINETATATNGKPPADNGTTSPVYSNSPATAGIDSAAPVSSTNNSQHTNFISPISINIESFAYLWLVGALMIWGYITLVNAIFYLKLQKYKRCTKTEIIHTLDYCKSKLHIRSKVSILYSEHIKSPMVWGILHPRILLPKNLLHTLTQEELSFILLHELAHIKRRDLPLNLIGMIIQSIYWFNPIIWYSMYKMKQDCEISCDATVLRVLLEDEYKKYGLTILNIMKRMNELRLVPGTAGFASKQNKRRIIMITQYKKTSAKWAVITLLCLTLLTGCASLTGSANSTDKELNTGTKNSDSSNTTTSDTTTPDPTTPVTPTEAQNNDTAPEDETITVINTVSFQQYFDLLGASKDTLLETLKEEPSKIDEGGLEFKENGIRIWFNAEYTAVSQVFTDRADIDFNGAKIGDKIDSFKEAFGEPVSDNNGDMHFKYDSGFISVNYDTQTEATFAVYLLSEDF